MAASEYINYLRIAEAIDYLRTNFKAQPDLDQVAAQINLSPFHFQRLFTDWAGTSPKKFLQYISVGYAKQILRRDSSPSLFDAALETGLSGTGRLHDLFVSIEGMSPGEYKNGGQGLLVFYRFSPSHFGNLLVASTHRGVCFLAFADNEQESLTELKTQFPKAEFVEKETAFQNDALHLFQRDWSNSHEIKLHLKASPFQLKVWEALLKIPMGKLCTYGELAQQIGMPQAARAVGTAIGNNPVAFLIPCHRVIQASGIIGGYRWNPVRKTALIGWEAAQIEADSSFRKGKGESL